VLLRSLIVKKLHHALDLEINFNEDITILVGINGSGKTSALNCIDWLLKPDLKKLAAEKFESIQLNFSWNEELYIIAANKTESLLTFSVVSDAISLPISPITIPLVDEVAMGFEDLVKYYDGIYLEAHEFPMWELLKSFPRPTVITLDRQLSAEADDVTYREQDARGPVVKKKNRSPIAHVQEVMFSKFSEYRLKAVQHDSELKEKILISAFQDPMEAFMDGDIKPMKDEDIRRLENKVIKHLSGAIMADEVTKNVRQFFKSSRVLARQLVDAPRNDNLAIGFMLLRYRQIENLAKAFNNLEVKNAHAFGLLKNFLAAVNAFFVDSGKNLYFEDTTGQLSFKRINKDKTEKDKIVGKISNLSSGEQQILILFTFLHFVAKSGTIFIVDEPELSLHPRWQNEFMKIFLSLRPKNTQLLLATHSPEIVAGFKNSCVPL
jgi:predicted ATP-binding protein involved in virulence